MMARCNQAAEARKRTRGASEAEAGDPPREGYTVNTPGRVSGSVSVKRCVKSPFGMRRPGRASTPSRGCGVG